MSKLHGTMMGGLVLLSADGSGVPVNAADAPEAPAGYVARARFVDSGSSIDQVWELVPESGTAADAAVTLAQMQAAKLDDGDALKVAALFPEWQVGVAKYAAGERVMRNGTLYRCLQDHAPQADWAPEDATSLWAKVLPGQSGTAVGEWAQPTGAQDAYAKGDRVTHNGKTWESTVDANVWEPGAAGITQWTEVA